MSYPQIYTSSWDVGRGHHHTGVSPSNCSMTRGHHHILGYGKGTLSYRRVTYHAGYGTMRRGHHLTAVMAVLSPLSFPGKMIAKQIQSPSDCLIVIMP